MEFPIEMYKIRQEDMRIKLPCERCLEKGIIDKGCNKCGGDGVHHKTIKVWKVAPRTETIKKIDRSSKDSFYHSTQTSYEGGLRYWTGMSEFYNEADRYLHFTKSDAQKECDKRNESIADILKVVESNNANKKDDDIDIYVLERRLELEQMRSSYWKCKANGENPVVFGSREIMDYIMS